MRWGIVGLSMTILYHSTFHQYPPQDLSYDPQKIDLETYLEHLGDSLVQGGHEWWRLSAAQKKVSLGFSFPFESNGTHNLMPRSAVSNLCSDAPMNWGTLWILASSKITMPNPNRMWSLENEIGYCRLWHDHLVAFNVLWLAPTSSKL